jgi:hypothetical protein
LEYVSITDLISVISTIVKIERYFGSIASVRQDGSVLTFKQINIGTSITQREGFLTASTDKLNRDL